MNKEKKLELIDALTEAAFKGGEEILKIYNSDFSVEHKEDNTPLTQADKNAHQQIVKYLNQTPYPILSEEGRDIPYNERKDWEYLWMVDPLDGTKEFIKRNGEFTVNIALIHQQKSILGVIYVPVKDEMYLGIQGIGSFKVNQYSQKQDKYSALLLEENALPKTYQRPYTIVGSRSHMSDETRAFMNQKQKEKGKVEVMAVGSSLKLCMVAEGLADDYPRFAPTMEWDTAAGQAIVEAMGGKVINWKTKEPLRYNCENLLNDWFLVTL